jgi:RHS repeat-associated protein
VGADPSHATSRKPASGQALAYQKLDTAGKATFWAQRAGPVATPGTTVKVADTAPAGDKWNLAAIEILAAVPRTSASYAYDSDGNLTKAGPVSLAYNQADQLTSYGTTATYSYDGDGLRVAKTVGGTQTAFAWDQSGSIPLLLSAGGTSYVYGPAGQPIEQVTGTTPGYLLADQSGSTRLITDASGAVGGTYTYSPYGTVTRQTGTATTALQYDGQYTDAESGYQYLQARYYNPATGQFLTYDPLAPLTGAPYGYAGGNPLNAGDPSGLAWSQFFAWVCSHGMYSRCGDYLTFGFSVGEGIGLEVTVTLTRDGGIFVSRGVCLLCFGVQPVIHAGWLDQPIIRCGDTDRFVSGWGVNAGGGYGPYYSKNWSNPPMDGPGLGTSLPFSERPTSTELGFGMGFNLTFSTADQVWSTPVRWRY